MVASLEPQTYLHIPCVTGGGNLVDSLAKWPYVTRFSYNTLTQWTFLATVCVYFKWTNVAVVYDRDDDDKTINAQSN